MSNILLSLPPKACNKFCINASGRPAKYCYGILIFIYIFPYNSGPGSSVGIATGCVLDGPGSNPSGDAIFRPSRPGLGLTQPTVKWVPCLS